MNEGVIDYYLNSVTSANANVLKKFSDLKGVDNKSIRNSTMKHNKKILSTIALKNKFIEVNNGKDDVIQSLKKKYKGTEYDGIVNSIYQKARNKLEDIAKNYKYEYILAVLNSKLMIVYLNAIRRHKQENYFYSDDLRKLPLKIIDDQTFFVNIFNILQFLYQYGGNKEIIDFFDKKLLNFIIYEIYFEGKLKEMGFYQDLLKEIKDNTVDIEYEKWIKLKFKSSLNAKEQDEKNRIETKNIEIINEIYNSVNTESVNNKIENMKEFDWIKKIEIT